MGNSLDNLIGENSTQLEKFKTALNPPAVEAEKLPESASAEPEIEVSESPAIEPEKVFSEVEKEAIGMGWDPDGKKAAGLGKRVLTAEEFVDRQEFFKEREKLKKEIKSLTLQNQKTREFAQKQAESVQYRTLEELMAKRDPLIREGNLPAVREIEAQMLRIQQQIMDLGKSDADVESLRETTQVSSTPLSEAPQVAKAQQYPPEILQFAEKNKEWFNNNSPINRTMSIYAAQVMSEVESKSAHLSLPEKLELVEQDVRKEFSKHFKNSKQDTPSAVALGSQKPGAESAALATARFLTPAQKELGAQFVKKGVYKNLDAYANALSKSGRLRRGDN
jgi:hypothetical protein